GDSADGFPGVPGWGEKAASTLLGRYSHLEDIPPASTGWAVTIRGAVRLSTALEANRELAMLFRRLATLRDDVPVFGDVDELRWRGAHPEFERVAERIAAPNLWERARRITPRD
ncbi:MAG TPA: 5'-3' exonuclease H3TH domain-containing protein, partial [Gemmatimonadales bacterium]|nr:5'-3' exonuclease H3TH domain-containing protein [Gemmatimonadales bacterium]